MTDTQIKDYLKKYRIDSEEQLAKHIEELKRNTIPNNEIIFPLVDLLLNEKSVLLSFFRENSKERGETAYIRTVTPFFLDEMLGKCSSQCFCDGSCKKPQEKNTNSTRHKSQAGETHKEIVGDLEGINRPPSTDDKNLAKKDNYTIYVFTKDLLPKILEFEDLRAIKSILKRYSASSYRVYDKDKNLIEQGVLSKDDVITNSNRGEKETMKVLNNLRDIINKSEVKIIKEVLEERKGVKHNQLKPRLDVVINTQFPKALQLIALATEYGNSKYKETDLDMLNFKRVVGGSQTYFDSCARHSTDRNGLDESGLPHIIHAVWSSLAGLELWAEENKINIKGFTENYMKNLQD